MRVCEIFRSIQGEGRLAGTPSVFIRTSGCNLRCVWCDTPYASWEPEGAEMGIQEIIDRVARDPCRHVVITGGEPFLARGLAQLTIRLRDRGHHITVETAGTVAARVACDLMSVSPKLSHSTPRERRQGRFAEMHERRRLNFGALQALVDGYDYQLKFVVEKPGDFGEIEQVLGRLRNVDRGRVLVMAQARTKRELRARSRWLVGQAKMRGFGYSPRLQIELFGNRRGV